MSCKLGYRLFLHTILYVSTTRLTVWQFDWQFSFTIQLIIRPYNFALQFRLQVRLQFDRLIIRLYNSAYNSADNSALQFVLYILSDEFVLTNSTYNWPYNFRFSAFDYFFAKPLDEAQFGELRLVTHRSPLLYLQCEFSIVQSVRKVIARNLFTSICCQFRIRQGHQSSDILV